MSNNLVVSCDSVNDTVTLTSDMGTLTTLSWSMDDNTTGFRVKNAEFLIDVYCADFYILDEAAIIQFIINVAEKIHKDQHLEEIVYLNSNGDRRPCPQFIPSTLDDSDLIVLPDQQINLCKIWQTFKDKFHGFMCEEFLDVLIPPVLRVGFIDLVNAELSLLKK